MAPPQPPARRISSGRQLRRAQVPLVLTAPASCLLLPPTKVLRLVIRLYEEVPSPDYLTICQCLMFLDDAREVAHNLHTLLSGSEDQALLAYQIGFDLVDCELQSFLAKVGGWAG